LTSTGAMSENYTVGSVTDSDAGDYKCSAINDVGFGVTLAQTLTVNSKYTVPSASFSLSLNRRFC
jgi:hypothetical protein